MTATPIERASPDDMVSIATDGQVPMQVGAVLALDRAATIDELVDVLGERIPGVPRLRQRLVGTPFGCGRPVWVDDPSFDLQQHVEARPCPAPGDEGAVLDAAAATVAARLPRDLPLWRAALLTEIDGDRSALVVVFHHVLADGIGGLAILAGLVDEMASTSDTSAPFPRPGPTRRALALDAARERMGAIRRVPAGLARVGTAARDLVTSRPPSAGHPSILRPLGSRRRAVVARAGLGSLVDAAHRHGVTVNDVVLAAVAGALGSHLEARGETIDRLVLSVPVSARRATTPDELGNQVEVMPVPAPTSGPAAVRLAHIAAATNAAKARVGRSPASLFAPSSRLAARVGLFGWLIERQRLVHSFVTNLRGPQERMHLAGATIESIVPITLLAGNVTIAFAALSYAGTLGITVIVDPSRWPDPEEMAAAVESQLALFADDAT